MSEFWVTESRADAPALEGDYEKGFTLVYKSPDGELSLRLKIEGPLAVTLWNSSSWNEAKLSSTFTTSNGPRQLTLGIIGGWEVVQEIGAGDWTRQGAYEEATSGEKETA